MMVGDFAERVRSLARHINYLQGKNCARHQISTVLLCGLAITSLFYPAFGLLLWTNKATRFWDINSSSFTSADFHTVFDTHYSFNLGTGEHGSNYSVETLVSPYDEHYDRLLADVTALSDEKCVKSADNCIILSPLSQFNSDPETTLAQFNGISYAITTILFSDQHDHILFNDKIGSLDAYAEPSLSPHKSISIHPRNTPTDHSSLPYIFGVAYALFIVYVSVSVSRLNQVHSRFGLAITGIAQLCVSTIMSISLLELCDWRLRLVPWTVVPFVIVVVGVENMLTITRAVVSTSISLPVPERVGQGMAKVGPVIGLTVLSDLTLLGIAGYLVPGTVREFCIFASVVSVIDYFLQSTFFITILSVDIQRLELSDLIHQGLQPVSSGADDPKKQKFTSHPLIVATKAVWKARSTRNASLLVLLLIMSTLYYITLPSEPLVAIDALTQANVVADKGSETFSELVWSILSHSGKDASVNMHINPPTFLTTYASQALIMEHEQNAMFSPRTRAFLWMIKVVVAPIGSSLVALYCLLLFLLKDKELHELQRSKLDESVQRTADAEVLSVNGQVKVVDKKADIVHAAATSNIVAYSTMLGDIIVLMDGERYVLEHKLRVSTLIATDTYVAVGMEDGSVRLWDVRGTFPQPVALTRPRTHSAPVHHLVVVDRDADADADTSSSTPLRSPPLLQSQNLAPKHALVCVHADATTVFWSLDSFECFAVTDANAIFVHATPSLIVLGESHAESGNGKSDSGDSESSNTVTLFSYDWQTRIRSSIGSLEFHRHDKLLKLVQLSRHGFVKHVAFSSAEDGSVRVTEVGDGYSEAVAELAGVPSVTKIEIVEATSPAQCAGAGADDAYLVYVVRSTLHSVFVDVVELDSSGSGVETGESVGGAGTGAGAGALAPTPMLLRNRSRSRKSGGGATHDDASSYPLANHGFSRRVSAAKGDSESGVTPHCKYTHTHPLLAFDAPFNAFTTLSSECVAGVRKVKHRWEAWCVRLEQDSMMVETAPFALNGGSRSENIQALHLSSHATDTASRTPRLRSLLNEHEQQRRREALKSPSKGILPTSRIPVCVPVTKSYTNPHTSSHTLLAFSNALVVLDYRHSTVQSSDKKHI